MKLAPWPQLVGWFAAPSRRAIRLKILHAQAIARQRGAARQVAVTESDVVEVLDRLEAVGVRAWVDGGWGVDALVGKATRAHADLDLALNREQLDVARRALEEVGFEHDRARQPGLPARLVMRDAGAREVDLQPLAFDAAGDGWQRLSASGMAWGRYPVDDLRATGTIGGRPVRCLSPQLQMRFRLGYEWSERDVHDVRLLVERFGVPAPPPFQPGSGLE
jgi:lincosamide nucleotidyltransferase A/C/D/E